MHKRSRYRARAPSAQTLRHTNVDRLLSRVRETEYVRYMETRLELQALVTDDPAYHPLGVLG